MKLSVRSKVANGLVICLLVPRVASTAVEVFVPEDDGLDAFSAEDEFLPGAENRPFATVHLQADPAAPGDPSACDDPSGSGVLIIDSATPLVTAESECDPSGGGGDPSGCGPFGNMDLIEVSMNPPPLVAREFRFETQDPSGMATDEATVSPSVVTFDGDLTCVPQNVWVTGVNDNVVDGDVPFVVSVTDEQDFEVDSIPGKNLDNDNYRGARITTDGPNSLPVGGNGVYTIQVTNVSGEKINKASLVISTSSGLAIGGYAAELVSGDKFKSKGSTKSGDLVFSNVQMAARDTLLVVVDVVLFDAGAGNQSVVARFEPSSGLQVDDDQAIRPALP
jgi:hypothetical protein